ncbi:hypothetical protein BDN72DRAFT_349192 [Pluteus cervinus]|uniref:Uncharacterized protein n=1 Tax=Pluteus cervinus TaxID=181527 RepID=A0ACD3BDP9_9AGAR|nr:hypothetical protein BDN72DRAFT_349192 [Pluteus cervinus]
MLIMTVNVVLISICFSCNWSRSLLARARENIKSCPFRLIALYVQPPPVYLPSHPTPFSGLIQDRHLLSKIQSPFRSASDDHKTHMSPPFLLPCQYPLEPSTIHQYCSVSRGPCFWIVGIQTRSQ